MPPASSGELRGTDIGAVNVWNRTDSCCVQRLSDFYVLIAKEPFGNDDLATLLEGMGRH